MKIFGAALLAVVVGSVISGLFWVITLFGFAGSMGGSAVSVMPNSILKIDLADNISDSPVVNPLSNLTSMNTARTVSLLSVLRAIEAAAADNRIKGIYLNFTDGGSASAVALEEMRAAIEEFKKSGKFVVAHNDSYSQIGYYLASVADKVYLQPEGGFNWMGLGTTTVFLKGALDKLGINCEVFRPTVCKYKSAVEPYILDKMSAANRKQNEVVVNSMWNTITTAVAQSRNTTVAQLNKLADTQPMMLAKEALAANLVDGLLYKDQMDDIFAEYGVEKNLLGKYEYITLGDYSTVAGANMRNLSAPKVGIIYAEGTIVDGQQTNPDGNIYGNTLAQTLAKARTDENIKAVVLRVNSPGGSALASDIIWREVELLKAAKPVIVSMGSYAASGGYYISAPADAIVANKLTITGSIGVFGMIMEGSEMFKKKLGVTFDGVKTNPSADFGQGFLGLVTRPFSTTERAMLIKSVDNVYETFTTKVANGRNLKIDDVLNISEGRIWSGTDALNIGLADANGGLKSAISIAADKAGIADNFRVEEVLEELNPFMAFMQSIGAQMRVMMLGKELDDVCSQYQSAKQALTLEGVNMYCLDRVHF